MTDAAIELSILLERIAVLETAERDFGDHLDRIYDRLHDMFMDIAEVKEICPAGHELPPLKYK